MNQRPEVINEAVERLRCRAAPLSIQCDDLELLLDYLSICEAGLSVLRGRAVSAETIRDREEVAFQRRLAELKATQVVQVVHGGKVS